MPKKKPPPEPGKLVASIETVEQTYFVAQDRDQGEWFDDEAILDVTGKIEEISPRHKRLLGERVEMSFVCSRRFRPDSGVPEGKPFLLSMNLKKGRCSFMAYLPDDAFWALPPMISSGSVTHIEARFGESYYGSADLLSIYFATSRKLAEPIP